MLEGGGDVRWRGTGGVRVGDAFGALEGRGWVGGRGDEESRRTGLAVDEDGEGVGRGERGGWLGDGNVIVVKEVGGLLGGDGEGAFGGCV